MNPRVWTIERETTIGIFLNLWLVKRWTKYSKNNVKEFASVTEAKEYLKAHYEEGGRYELKDLKVNKMLYMNK